MKLTFDDYEQMTVMKLHGDLTADDTELIRRAAQKRLDQQVRDFVLDMADVEFVDSQGLETLLWLQDRCAEQLGQIRLAATSQNVEQILVLTRLVAHLETKTDVDSAIKSLR